MSRDDALLLLSFCIPIAACTTGKLDLGGTLSTDASLGPNDVAGIVQLPDGSPVAIDVLSGDTLTHTDQQGRFVLHDVPSRYDVALGVPPGTANTPYAVVYAGLTTRRPILTVSGLPPANYSGPFVNSYLNVAYPAPTVVDAQHLVFLDLPDKRGTSNLSGFPGTTVPQPTFIFLPPGTSSADAQVASFDFTGPQGEPAANYLGYASATLHFEVGSTTNWTPNYSPVESMTVVGSPVLGDPSQQLYESYLYMRLSDNGNWASVFPAAPVRSPPYSFVIPKVPGVSWAIQFNAFGPGRPGSDGGAGTWAWARVGADGSVPSVRIPPAPRTVSPPDGTTGFGVGSVLTWTGEGVCTASVTSAGNSNLSGPSISIVTDQKTATIPDLSALGITLPSLVTYNFSVSCAESSEPPYGGDPVLLPNDPLASGGHSVQLPATTVVTR